MSVSGPGSERPSLGQMLRVFAFIGATSFGQSLTAYFERELCQRRGWISEPELLEDISIANVLPGALGGNLTVLLGRRLGGVAGAVGGVAGIYGPGATLMLLASALYAAGGRLSSWEPLFHGLALAAAGISVGNSLGMAGREIRTWRAVPLVPLAFFAVAVLHIETLLAVALLGSLGIFFFRNERTPKQSSRAAPLAPDPGTD